MHRFTRAGRYLGLAVVTVVVALLGSQSSGAAASSALTGVDLSRYVRVGRFDLPEPTRTAAPANSLLAQEASSVTYDWDTDTLFVVGDGGTSVVQVTKTGALIDSMTLAPGPSPQGTDFYDTEGITYVGGGKFVLAEERYRQLNLFTYVAGGVLHRTDAETVKLGTTIDNIGIEGVSNDPSTGGFIVVKEKDPEGIFQTGVDFAAGTATNGSPTTENSTNLFDPALAGLSDFSDVFALSNLTSLSGPDTSHLLIISQESGKIVNVDRSGVVSSSLTIVGDPGNPLSVPDQTHEGVTMDNDGNLYTVSEDGGGDVDHPQLWVYAPSTATNQAPTAVALTHQVTSVAENTSTVSRLKVADVAVTDDGLGTNNLTVSGPDASSFEVDSTGLYIKAGTALDFETKSSYSVTVNVDDPSVGATPDASANFTLAVTDVANEGGGTAGQLAVTEVSPWSSGNAPYAADWWEVSNLGSSVVSLVGWKMDDNSNSFGNAVALNGVSSLGPGQSAVFIEGDASTAAAFESAWFGSSVPAGFAIGWYSGSGVGLSTGGDAVNIFDSAGNRVTGVSFGASTNGRTFDNTVAAGSSTLPLPTISTLSSVGVNGAWLAPDGIEVGSPIADTHPPTIVATASPSPNANGWNNTDVTVSYSCTDEASGVDPAASSLGSDVLTASGTATGTCVDRAGHSATATYTARIDKVSPVVVYSGNAGSYGLLDTVAISCTAADALSGIASSTCANANGPAWTFGAGTHTLSATATDLAGNSGSAQATFAVRVTAATIATLTRQFVQGSAKYQALGKLQKVAADVLVTVAANVMLDVKPTAAAAQKARQISLYKTAIQVLVRQGWLTSGQAATLGSLADAL
jgi:uncharacterized protein YjiK